MRCLLAHALGLMAALAAVSKPAGACGLTPPIGPNGLPAACRGDESGLPMRIGVTAGGTSTRIDFAAASADLRQGATTATFDVFPVERLGLSLAGGASLGGHVDYGGQRFDLLPGPVGGVGVSYRFLGGTIPFIHVSLTGSLARTTTRASDGSEAIFTSRDWRVGVAVGQVFGKWIAPFAVVRYFGAGTNWSVAGGKGADAFRYHVGVGATVRISERVDALGELAFLGEKRATLGVGYSF